MNIIISSLAFEVLAKYALCTCGFSVWIILCFTVRSDLGGKIERSCTQEHHSTAREPVPTKAASTVREWGRYTFVIHCSVLPFLYTCILEQGTSCDSKSTWKQPLLKSAKTSTGDGPMYLFCFTALPTKVSHYTYNCTSFHLSFCFSRFTNLSLGSSGSTSTALSITQSSHVPGRALLEYKDTTLPHSIASVRMNQSTLMIIYSLSTQFVVTGSIVQTATIIEAIYSSYSRH